MRTSHDVLPPQAMTPVSVRVSLLLASMFLADGFGREGIARRRVPW